MTEFFTIKSIDNSRLVRPVSPERLRDFWRRVAGGGVLAAFGLLYTWQHFQCIQIRYEVEGLQAQRNQDAERNQELRLDIASLRSPGRIDAIAKQLGLTVPVPGQVTPLGGSSDAMLAQARISQPARP